MAFSHDLKDQDILGTKFVKVFHLNFADVTSGHVKTGLSKVMFASCNNETGGVAKVAINKNAANSAAENGSIHISGATADDLATLFVYGI